MKQTTVDVENELWDILVIGAGPAGAFAARELARSGLKTLLVESKSFPRGKVCGGCINGRALALLQSVGLGSLCEDLGGVRLSSVEVHSGRQKVRIALPIGVAVSRGALDPALVQVALNDGVEFLSETKATVTEVTDSCSRHVLLKRKDSQSMTVRAKVVLACDGLNHSSLRKLSEFESRVSPRARIGVGGIVPADTFPCPQGQILMVVGRRGYVGITHVEKNQLNLAAAVDAKLVHELGVGDAVLHLLKNSGFTPAKAIPKNTFHGTPQLTRHTPSLAAERLFLLGDSAGYVEPFSGEGMAMAWTSAKQIIPLATHAAASWDSKLIQQWNREYRQAVGKRQTICRAITTLARHPWAVRATLAALRVCPGLCAPIVRRINKSPLDLKVCNV